MNNILKSHFLSPRNLGELEIYNFKISHKNPICGDQVIFYIKINENNDITDIRYEAYGCSVFIALCSYISEKVYMKNIEYFILWDFENDIGNLEQHEKHVVDIGKILQKKLGDVYYVV